MELLIQMALWVFFCLIIMPMLITMMIIFLWKLAHRPPRPKVTAPGIMRRWNGDRKYLARQAGDAWSRDFGETMKAAEAARPPGRGSTPKG